MRIQIVDVPQGEAPEAIRQAWVGLVLPLVPGETGPRKVISFGVLTAPRGFFGELWHLVTGRFNFNRQYLVPSDSAIEALKQVSPEAAAWWLENTPNLFGKGRAFGFAPEVCTEIPEPVDIAPELEKLQQLYREGVLTEKELAAAKAALIERLRNPSLRFFLPGIGLIIFGILITAGSALRMAADKQETMVENLLGFIFLGVVPLIYGTLLCFRRPK